MEPKTLLDAIGNALFQEKMVRGYEVREATDNTIRSNYTLRVVLADPGATEPMVETLVSS
jgi:hypothetical protein